MFKKILCPLDFSPRSDHALQVAARMAAQAGAELLLVHVWDLPPLLPMKFPLPADVVQVMMNEQERGLAVASREATRLGVTRVTTSLLNGVAWEQIAQAVAGDAELDLVVIGTHGRTGIARVLLGSVAEKVARHASCSVLAVRPRGDVKAFEHVLCPIDFSDTSRQAVARAAELATPGGAGITLFHAIELPVIYSGEVLPSDLFADADERTEQLIEQWAAELRAKVQVPVTTLVETGGPGALVLDLLDRDPTYDLVVVGSQGRTGLRRVLLGSVAEKIMRHASCPVLVARAPA